MQSNCFFFLSLFFFGVFEETNTEQLLILSSVVQQGPQWEEVAHSFSALHILFKESSCTICIHPEITDAQSVYAWSHTIIYLGVYIVILHKSMPVSQGCMGWRNRCTHIIIFCICAIDFIYARTFCKIWIVQSPSMKQRGEIYLASSCRI